MFFKRLVSFSEINVIDQPFHLTSVFELTHNDAMESKAYRRRSSFSNSPGKTRRLRSLSRNASVLLQAFQITVQSANLNVLSTRRGARNKYAFTTTQRALARRRTVAGV